MASDIVPRLQQALQNHGQGRLDAAEKLYRDVLRDAPHHPDALHLLGVLTHQRGDAASAESLIRRALDGSPGAANYWNNLANVLASQGKLMDAVAAYDRAIAIKADDALAHLNRGLILRQLGRADAAIESYRRAIELRPDFAEAHNKLAGVYTALFRLEEAAAHFRKAIDIKPDYLDARASLANVLRAQGLIAEAAGQYQKVLTAQPHFPEMHYGLGMVRKDEGKPNEAAECFRRAIKFKPDYAEAHHSLGDVRLEQGRLSEALKCYRRALEVDPDLAEARLHLGVVQRRLGDFQSSIDNYQKALKSQPLFAEALHNLGVALIELGRYDAAERYLLRALEIRPDYADALNNLGFLRLQQNRQPEAEEALRAAIALRPDNGDAYANLGLLLKDRGDLEGSLAAFRRGRELCPDHANVHAALIFALDTIPSSNFEEQQAERRRWYERHGKRFATVAKRHTNDRDPERKLRVGYVSADFRQHSAVYAFGPILRLHDPERFELICYSGVTVEDQVTAALKGATERWRPTIGLSDDELAAQIREDGIDILVDLSGHTAGNRLLVFARKPAPVQVTAWGHATGTGLETMDYLFGDPLIVPADARPFFAEKIFDLPCAINYEAPRHVPDVVPLPAASGAPITFGSLNRLSKLTEATMALWARLLTTIPDARLLIKDRQLHTQAERDRILGIFERFGVAASRLELQGGSSHVAHLAAYGQVDIALDPFPQNGGITTLEALWMGVPVVALLGHTIPGRSAAAILSAAGLGDWVAATEDEYLALAVAKARNVEALAGLRRDLRSKLAGLPVGNPQLYTRAVEVAYREMWRRWCGVSTAG